MTRLMIDVPEDLAEKLRARAVQGGYADEQDYLRALIAADTDEGLPVSPTLVFHDKSELEKLLVEGLHSGDSGEISSGDWVEMRQSLRERFSNSNPK